MTKPLILFDPVGTLGVLSSPTTSGDAAHFCPYPDVSRRLRELGSRFSLSAVVVDGAPSIPDAIARSEMGSILSEVILSVRGCGESAFEAIARRVGARERVVVYVSSSSSHTERASKAGMVACPHPALAESAAVPSESLCFLRVEGAWAWPDLVRGRAIVPMHIETSIMYAVGTRSAVRGLTVDGVNAREIGKHDSVARTTLAFLRFPIGEDDPAIRAFVEKLAVLDVYERLPNGALVSLPAAESDDSWHPPAASHGHTVGLLPHVSSSTQPAAYTLRLDATGPADDDIEALDSALMQSFVDPLIGNEPIPESVPIADHTPIVSRHTWHGDNRRAVAYLSWRLGEILGEPSVRILHFRHAWLGELVPQVEARLEGSGGPDEIVVLGAHLDSFAGDRETAALGADDDASGVAAVLAIAAVHQRMVARHGKPPKRTIRYLLFNSEEQVMQGSAQYVTDLRESEGIDVAGMIQLDMIGWKGDSRPPRYEIHAGSGPGGMAEALADLIQLCGDRFAKEGETPFQPERFWDSRECRDPGARSDHVSFSEYFPACLICEDMFPAVCGSAEANGNPAYHLPSDTEVDIDYATALARTAAAASWIIANQ